MNYINGLMKIHCLCFPISEEEMDFEDTNSKTDEFNITEELAQRAI